jgi:flagellar biosynthetic protein FlhB
VELLKSLIKVSAVGFVAFSYLKQGYPSLAKLAVTPFEEATAQVGALCWGLLTRTCAVIAVIAILDYMYQKIHLENSLKMTKQEVKEEYKRSEGDPQVKGQIRRRQRAMARRRRMMQDVPKADVVITNPTHLAVALKYDPSNMSAPIVLAKGQRLIAQQIKAIAAEHDITIVENKPVARMLYKVVEVGEPIPEDMYQAVAEILAFVFRVSRKAAVGKPIVGRAR